jgi:putative membrane protein
VTAPPPGVSSRYPLLLLSLFAVVVGLSAIHPIDRKDWLLENVLSAIFAAALLLSRRAFPLSHLSYTLIFVFLCLHTIGSHYTYSLVPYDRWWAAMFGRSLSEMLGVTRNYYDRLVHFSFGLLLAYPTREVFCRVAGARGFWGYYLPLDLMMSFSMLYELIEWAAAVMLGGELGQAFLGTQGDVWDAQKDMALATLGALISMTVVAAINYAFDRNFGDDLRESLTVKEGPMGEIRMQAMMNNRKQV